MSTEARPDVGADSWILRVDTYLFCSLNTLIALCHWTNIQKLAGPKQTTNTFPQTSYQASFFSFLLALTCYYRLTISCFRLLSLSPSVNTHLPPSPLSSLPLSLPSFSLVSLRVFFTLGDFVIWILFTFFLIPLPSNHKVISWTLARLHHSSTPDYIVKPVQKTCWIRVNQHFLINAIILCVT